MKKKDLLKIIKAIPEENEIYFKSGNGMLSFDRIIHEQEVRLQTQKYVEEDDDFIDLKDSKIETDKPETTIYLE